MCGKNDKNRGGKENSKKHKGEKMKKIQRIILAFMLGIVPIQVALANSKADALADAALNGDLEQVKTLIEKEGVDINAKESEAGATALMWASGYKELEVVQYLINKGADINAKIDNGRTALMWASMKGHLEVVKALVEGKSGLLSMFSKGADINAKTNYGETALILASMKGHLEVVKYLINKGADINAKMKFEEDGEKFDGTTALMVATGEGHLEVVKYIISKGATVNAVMTAEIKGVVLYRTALDAAMNNKHHKVAEVLKNAGAKTAYEIKK